MSENIMRVKCSPGTRVWLAWRSLRGTEFNNVVGGTIRWYTCVATEEFEGLCFFILWDAPVKDHFACMKTIEPISECGKSLFFSLAEAKRAIGVSNNMVDYEGKIKLELYMDKQMDERAKMTSSEFSSYFMKCE